MNILHLLALQTVIEKECTGHGVLACAKALHTGDFVPIPESFGAHIISKQAGVLWFRISLNGVPAHVLEPAAVIIWIQV